MPVTWKAFWLSGAWGEPPRAAVTLASLQTARRVAAARPGSFLSPPAAPVVYGDVVTGSASPTGSIAESWSVLSLEQMTVQATVGAVAQARKARLIRYRSFLGRGYVETITRDSVTGTAAPSGSVVESWSWLTLQQMTVRVALAALALRRKRQTIRYHSQLSPPAAVAHIYTDAVTGSAAPTGSVVEQKTYTETLAGSAAASGAASENAAYADAVSGSASPAGVFSRVQGRVVVWLGRRRGGHVERIAPTVVTLEQEAGGDSPSGSATPTGSVVESWSWLTPRQLVLTVKLAAVRIARQRAAARYESFVAPPRSLAQTYTDTVTGAASPTGSVTESKTGADSPTGTASPSGQIALAAARLMAWLGGRRGHGGHVVHTGPAVLRAEAAAGGDSPTGASQASGTVTDALTRSGAVSGAASPSGAATDARTGADAPSGSATPAGSATDARTGADAPTGTASPSGTLTDAFAASDTVSGVASPAGTLTETKTGTDSPSGTDAPSGSVVEAGGEGDTPHGAASPSGAASEAHTHAGSPSGQANPGGSATDTLIGPGAAGAGGADNTEPNWGPLITSRRSRLQVRVGEDGWATVYEREPPLVEDEDELLVLGLLE